MDHRHGRKRRIRIRQGANQRVVAFHTEAETGREAEAGAAVAELARGRGPLDLLFPGVDKDVMRKAVRMVCRAAGVPEVSPYGLRGSYSSAQAEEGRAPQAIMDATGHESFTTTKESYLRLGALAAGEQRGFTEVVGPAIERRLEALVPGTEKRSYQPPPAAQPSEKPE